MRISEAIGKLWKIIKSYIAIDGSLINAVSRYLALFNAKRYPIWRFI